MIRKSSLRGNRELSPFALEPEDGKPLAHNSHPTYGHRKAVGKKVILIPERINGRQVYLGKYKDFLTAPS